MLPSPLQPNKPKPPFIYICGAGPGDVGLLTLKTYHIMQHLCDVVVYDRLIPDEIINLIPQNIEKIYAGKSCKKHHMTQDEINETIVKKAKEGKIVLRLKGGDPFIFGRGYEELQFALKHNINCEVVPGVNAADGCAASLNIPLTLRGVATSVIFLTAHKQQGAEQDLDWQALVKEDRTIVFFMGLTRIEEIIDNLIKYGMDENMPSVAIESGTTKNERHCFAKIKDLAKEVNKNNLQAPTLVIVGRVVK